MFIKIKKNDKPSSKEISVGNLIKLEVVFGKNEFSRYADFKVLQLENDLGFAELVHVPEDQRSFDKHQNLIGYKIKFNKNDVVDVKE